ncbi:MAG: hypothetical protein QXX79_03600 [Candidatus Bathyarchaeia archaeon]
MSVIVPMGSMRAQVTLTPAEAKRLIAKAVIRLEAVKNALNDGIVAIHPSTTTSFIIEELYGKFPTTGFVCGIVTPRGTCISSDMLKTLVEGALSKPGEFRPWIIMRGKLHEDIKLEDILKKMDSDDVYIKTGNALDSEGNVGVFVGSPAGGTIGAAFSICAAKGINLVIPIGLEKLIPIPIRKASMEAGIKRVNCSMGMPVGLLPINGTVITELEAVKILTGASAIPIGAGGVAGAEGATTMILKGEETQVKEAVKLVDSIKGTKLPPISMPHCVDCMWPTCPSEGKAYTWNAAKFFKR